MAFIPFVPFEPYMGINIPGSPSILHPSPSLPFVGKCPVSSCFRLFPLFSYPSSPPESKPSDLSPPSSFALLINVSY